MFKNRILCSVCKVIVNAQVWAWQIKIFTDWSGLGLVVKIPNIYQNSLSEVQEAPDLWLHDSNLN